MEVSGVTSTYEAATIQSIQAFTPPFTLQASVMGTMSDGNAFDLIISSENGGLGVGIDGNLNSANGPYYGIWDGYSQGVGTNWNMLADKLVTSPSLNTLYQLTIMVDSSGNANLVVASGGQTLGGITKQLGLANNQFYVILVQWEGLPYTIGPNQAYWQSVNLGSTVTLTPIQGTQLSQSYSASTSWTLTNPNIGANGAGGVLSNFAMQYAQSIPFTGSVSSFGAAVSDCTSKFTLGINQKTVACFDAGVNAVTTISGDVSLVMDFTPGGLVAGFACPAVTVALTDYFQGEQQNVGSGVPSLVTTVAGQVCQWGITIGIDALLGTPFALTVKLPTSTSTPLSKIQTLVVAAPTDSAWFVLPDFTAGESGSMHTSAGKCGGYVAALATDVYAGTYLFGALTNPAQNEVLDTNGAYVSQSAGSCGQPLTSTSQPLVAVAGPVVNEVVGYYEESTMSPLYYNAVECIVRRDTGAYLDCSTPTATNDVFVMEAFTDPAGRTVFIIYGRQWGGTLAGFEYLVNFVLKNPSAYTSSWYVYRWQDATSGPSANGIPDPGDTYTPIASGP
jgi:hypothetical protein